MRCRRLASSLAMLCTLFGSAFAATPAVDIGSRRELFVDRYLIDEMKNAQLKLHPPRDAGTALKFDQPWEGPFCNYATVLKDGDRFLLYYRGMPKAEHYVGEETTCVAESKDGIHWTRPNVGQFVVKGEAANNAVATEADTKAWTMAPFIDTKPGIPTDERFKAVICESIFDAKGKRAWALNVMASADGLKWKRLSEKPVLYSDTPKFAFDSLNVAFWSETENKYVLFGRTNLVTPAVLRQISRWTSDDFINWSPRTLMQNVHADQPTPPEQLYTNQTEPYFRSPHIYIATPARLVLRQALSAEQLKAVPTATPAQAKSISDTAFATSRANDIYDRTFMESWIRPGAGAENWLTRSNYAASGIVQTGPEEMSVYVIREYGLPTAHVQRYTLRLDGFASVNAPYTGGELLTKPFKFAGNRLTINYSTSAVGSIQIELQDAAGQPIEGFTLADGSEIVGDEIDRTITWNDRSDLSALAGKDVRLRVRLRDADLYSLQFLSN